MAKIPSAQSDKLWPPAWGVMSRWKDARLGYPESTPYAFYDPSIVRYVMMMMMMRRRRMMMMMMMMMMMCSNQPRPLPCCSGSNKSHEFCVNKGRVLINPKLRVLDTLP